MTLAAAITKTFAFEGSFKIFCSNTVRIRDSIVIEINAAGQLSPFLQLLPKHKQYCFPEIDIQRMDLTDRINRCDYSLGHSGARSRFEGCFARILARAETGWTSLLHHTDRDRPADPQPAPVAAKSSRKPRHDAR